MTDSPLAFTASKRGRGRVPGLAFWEQTYYVYADKTMWLSSRQKLKGRHKWTKWSDLEQRGSDMKFTLVEAAKAFKREGFSVKWIREIEND